MRDVNHVLLTRFNLPSPGAERFVRAQDGWLEQRSVLFEKFCLPSVRSQSAQNLDWIIYFDPDSPGWLKQRIDRWRADGSFSPIFRRSVDRTELVADLRATVDRPSARLLTTNLDNDDGIATNFSERLQQAATHERRTALYLTDGLILHQDRVYRRADRENAFCSVVESWDDPVTCWADWHNMLKRTMPIDALRGEPAWLQVVHGGNVSNRVHGRMVSPRPYVHLFPETLGAVPEPRRRDLLRQNVVAMPARAGVHVLRSSARKAAILLVGKDGLNRLKDAIASRTKTEVESN